MGFEVITSKVALAMTRHSEVTVTDTSVEGESRSRLPASGPGRFLSTAVRRAGFAGRDSGCGACEWVGDAGTGC